MSCAPFTNAGSAVVSTSNAGAPPSMMGGPLMEGTYLLTTFAEYNSTTNSNTHKETFVFANGTVKHAGSENGAADAFIAGTYSASGTTLTLSLQCPQPMTVVLQYTATLTTLAYIAPNNANQLQTYTRQ